MAVSLVFQIFPALLALVGTLSVAFQPIQLSNFLTTMLNVYASWLLGVAFAVGSSATFDPDEQDMKLCHC